MKTGFEEENSEEFFRQVQHQWKNDLDLKFAQWWFSLKKKVDKVDPVEVEGEFPGNMSNWWIKNTKSEFD